MKTSLIIPTYNEEKNIRKTVEKLEEFLKKESGWEIIFVNDGSKDETLTILKSFPNRFFSVLSYKKNKGKGFAVKKGVEVSKGDNIIFMDSDLAYSFKHLKKIVESLEEGEEIVIGSRSLSKENNSKIPILRKILGKGFNKISKAILYHNLKDTQCGLKGFQKDIAKDLFSKQVIKGFSFDIELLFIAMKKGYKIKEIGVVVSKGHQDKKSKVRMIRDPFKMFFDLIKIRLNYFLNKYD